MNIVPAHTKGKVYITGAGPGDINLLTLRAKAVVELADVILYDNLVNPAILDWAKPGAEKIFVGKLPYCSIITQETIHRWMLDHAKAGKQVVRLKGGDPLLFGRGGKKPFSARAPGRFRDRSRVTAASPPAPMQAFRLPTATMRRCCFVTGHTKNNKTGLDFDWPMLAAFTGTIVYMGVRNLEQIAAKLIDAGRPAGSLVAVVENASLPQQKTVTGTLCDIAIKALNEEIGTPALIIVGEVVKYHRQINWFAGIQEQLKQQIA
ncbi:MAG: uroporphyrinogen-III C-methyltransferase [Flavihumibacter sp.]